MDKTSEQHLLLLNEVKKMKKTIVSWRQDRGHWRTNFRINGKRIYKKIPLLEKNQKAEAVEFATQLYMRYIRGEMFDECKITFKEATQSYFEHNSVSEKSKKTDECRKDHSKVRDCRKPNFHSFLMDLASLVYNRTNLQLNFQF